MNTFFGQYQRNSSFISSYALFEAPSSQIFGEKDEFDSESPRSSDSAKVWEKEQGEAGSVAGSRTNCSDFSDSGFSDEKNIQSCDLLDDY